MNSKFLDHLRATGFFDRLRRLSRGRSQVTNTRAPQGHNRPVILVHGYSDRGASFQTWKTKLVERGFNAEVINIVTYESLTNEVTIKDLAEGFDRALRTNANLKNKDNSPKEFDVIVHSTGMLVVRSWLVADRDKQCERLARIKHLVAFAPATFGSPLAHKGRGVLGAIFKGNKHQGPDFLEAGDLILDGLELASKYTWDLANVDLFGSPREGEREGKTFYGHEPDTPYPFIFCGNRAYDGIRGLINDLGSDGTVRWAGVSLNSRKITMDLTYPVNHLKRLTTADWTNVDCPVMFVDDRDHGSIVSDPDEGMLDHVVSALLVGSHDDFVEWLAAAGKWSKPPKEAWQQFVVRLVDERGDSITDYSIRLFTKGNDKPLKQFDADVHAYAADKSFRCFHVNLDELKPANLKSLYAEITVSSGTVWIGYDGYSSPNLPALPDEQGPPNDESEEKRKERLAREALRPSPNTLQIDLSPHVGSGDSAVKFFFGFTTTMIEIRINREPLPFGDIVARVCRFESF
jgi:pimeloyl-ACP methyl ester carboxylesterase